MNTWDDWDLLSPFLVVSSNEHLRGEGRALPPSWLFHVNEHLR